MPTDFLTVLFEFQERNIRYVLVGGLAVLLHGVDRLTADIDLVVDLAPEQALRAVETLLTLGFKANGNAEGFYRRMVIAPPVRISKRLSRTSCKFVTGL